MLPLPHVFSLTLANPGSTIVRYYCHIHPFHDGDGEANPPSTVYDLIKHIYVPVILIDIDRKGYYKMISNADD